MTRPKFSLRSLFIAITLAAILLALVDVETRWDGDKCYGGVWVTVVGSSWWEVDYYVVLYQPTAFFVGYRVVNGSHPTGVMFGSWNDAIWQWEQSFGKPVLLVAPTGLPE